MIAYHGTYYAVSASIKQNGIKNPAYLTLDVDIAETYAYARAREHNSEPCIVTVTLPDNWTLTPDVNTEDDDLRDAWVSPSIPARCISSIDKIAHW